MRCPTSRGGRPGPVRSRIAAVVVHLYVGQFLSKKRTAKALAELFSAPLRVVCGKLVEAEVVGFDETGLRVEGRLRWVHCARTDKYTLVTCHPKHGTAGINDLGVLGRLRGVAVHDPDPRIGIQRRVA